MIHAHNVNKDGLVGTISVELFPWKERIQKAKEIYYKMVDGKLVEREPIEQGELTQVTTAERVREVKLSFEDKEIKDFDTLMYYKEGIEILNELNNIVLGGVSLGKKQKTLLGFKLGFQQRESFNQAQKQDWFTNINL